MEINRDQISSMRADSAVNFHELPPPAKQQRGGNITVAGLKPSIAKRCRQYFLWILYYFGLTVCLAVVFLMVVLPVLVVGHGARWIASWRGCSPETTTGLFPEPVAERLSSKS
jgi:hypothetical protein